MDPAARLGVPPDADAAAVRAGFARQMRAVHPDTAGDEAADPAEVAALIEARDLALARLAAGAPLQPPNVVFYHRRRWWGGAGHVVARRRRRRKSPRVLL